MYSYTKIMIFFHLYGQIFSRYCDIANWLMKWYNFHKSKETEAIFMIIEVFGGDCVLRYFCYKGPDR